MKEAIEKYNQYFNTFTPHAEILSKYVHTNRVIKLSHNIAINIDGITDDEINLIMLGALFHDIARFKQYQEYQTYADKLSFDHGDMGVNILNEKNFFDLKLSPSEKETILFIVKNHNKYICENDKNEQVVTYTDIVRDADKIDIIVSLNNEIDIRDNSINERVFEDLLNKSMVKNEFCHNSCEYLLRSLGFIFDLKYPYSISYLLKSGIIESKISLIKKCCPHDLDNIIKVENSLNEYIKERLSC